MPPLRKRLKTDHVASEDGIEALSDASSLADHSTQSDAADDQSPGPSSGEDDDIDVDSKADDESSTSSLDNGGDLNHNNSSRQNGAASKSRTAVHKQAQPQKPVLQIAERKDGISASGHGLNAQVESVLQRIRPKHTRREIEAEEALHNLRTTIEAVPSLGPFSIKDARQVLKEQKIAIPFPRPEPPNDSNLKFAYARPATMNVVGSYPSKTAYRSRKFLYVDMVVQMPDDLFQEKDYINYRYFYKRAFYLACLASAIKAAHGKVFELRYQYHHDDPLRPILTIRALEQQSSTNGPAPARKWQINILPSISPKVFAAPRLVPDKVNIRQVEVRDDDRSKAELAIKNAAYNSSLRADMLVTSYLKLLHQATISCEAYRDACSLGSTWLKKRGFRATPGKGGCASFEWAALVALLLSGETAGGRSMLASHSTSIQIFKATLQLLATRDLIKRPLEVGDGVPLSTSTPKTGPIVWDAGRAHNVLYKVPAWSFQRLQAEAKLTLAMLGDPSFDGFEASFVTSKDIHLLDHDFMVRFKTLDLQRQQTTHDSSDMAHDLYQLLRHGLGDRVTHIDITISRAKAWFLQDSHRRGTNEHDVLVGLTVDPKNVNRAVDHGPPAEDKPAAEAFRKFWGPKAELRRFKDGSILEALVWETGPDKPSPLEQIIRYLLQNKYGGRASEHVQFVADGYEQVLPGKQIAVTTLTEPFRKFETDIRGLQAIPLPIRQIVPAGSLDANSVPETRRTVPIDVVMQFESSTRWPDDLCAIQRTKLAFLLQIGSLLQESVSDVRAMVGLENEGSDILNQGFLDVSYPGIAAFRLRIFHDREQTLIERMLKNKESDQRSTELAAQALAVYRREFLKRPSHGQAMTQLSSKHAVLKKTRQLLATWVASHLLHNHIPAELVDLFTAYTFTRPWPWQVPTSVQTAFLRTLVWLAQWDWRSEPLIVDLGTDTRLHAQERKAISTRFDAWRKLDPAMNKVAMFVASSVDPDGTTYTSERPSKVVASRLTALARAASAEIHAKDLQLQPSSLFSSGLADFDFVLHLNPRVLVGSTGKRSKGQQFRNSELNAAADIVEVAADPARDYLAELETLYSSVILFLSGIPHRPIIGGLWTPQTAARPWKMNLAFSSLPVQAAEGIEAQLNAPAILAEISRLGEELIHRIEVIKPR